MSYDPEAIRDDFSRILEGAGIFVPAPEDPRGSSPAAIAEAPPAAYYPDAADAVPREHMEPELGGKQHVLDFGRGGVNSIMGTFPTAFLRYCVLLFLVPTWQMAYLSYDREVQYFIGFWPQVVVWLSVPPAICALIQVRRGRPVAPVVLAGLMLLAFALLSAGEALLANADGAAARLQSTDCDALPAKRGLEESWRAANSLFATCLKKTVEISPLVQAHGLTVQDVGRLVRFQDCTEYAEGLAKSSTYRRDWPYLREAEMEHGCSGWCSRGPQLWSNSTSKDACHVAISQVFRRKVKRSATQVVASALALVLLTSAAFAAALPKLELRRLRLRLRGR